MSAPASGFIRLPVPKIRCEKCGHGDEDNLRRVASRGIWKCRRLRECKWRTAKTRAREVRDSLASAGRAALPAMEVAHVSRKSKRPLVKDTPRGGTKKTGRYAVTPGSTFKEIAAELGVSRARVQQLEASALKKVKKAVRRLGIKEEDILGDGHSP